MVFPCVARLLPLYSATAPTSDSRIRDAANALDAIRCVKQAGQAWVADKPTHRISYKTFFCIYPVYAASLTICAANARRTARFVPGGHRLYLAHAEPSVKPVANVEPSVTELVLAAFAFRWNSRHPCLPYLINIEPSVAVLVDVEANPILIVARV